MATGTNRPNRIAGSFRLTLLAAAAFVILTLVGNPGLAWAEEPVAVATPEATPTRGAAPIVVKDQHTYNIFNFPSVGKVLEAVLEGLSEALEQAVKPAFATVNLVLKTPTLASDGSAAPGQLNFYALVEPLWRLAALPVAGVLGFALILYSGLAIQLSAASRSPRGIGDSMGSLLAAVGGLALAFFSLPAFHLANEADNVLVEMIVRAPGPGQGADTALLAGRVLSGAGLASALVAIIVAVILLIPTLLLLTMAVARWALFFVVAVLSPIAAVSLGSAPTRRLTSLWAQMFMFVMLLGPVNAVLLRSVQALYDVALASLGPKGDVPQAVVGGVVMFSLLSMAGALNYAAVQRAFGAALGWVATGVSVAVGGLALAGVAAGAVIGGGGLAALGGSLSRVGGAAGPGSLTTAGRAASVGDTPLQGSSHSGGGQGYGAGEQSSLGGQLSLAGAGSWSAPTEPGDDTPMSWRERYRAGRRQGFDWSRAAVVGGSIAAMAPGPVGRAGMAARLLGMAGMVENRFRRGVDEREEAREEARERWARADLREQRSLIFGRPSGPEQVERANAIDRATANVGRRTADQEGLRTGLANLGRSARRQAPLGGDAYDGVARMGQGHGGSEPSGIERVAGLYLEAEIISRGTLRGEPVYAVGETGKAQIEIAAADGIGRSLGLYDGSQWADTAGEAEQLHQQALDLAQRLRAIGYLPQGRAYAEELGRDPSLAGKAESLARLEAYVKQLEDSRPGPGQAGEPA